MNLRELAIGVHEQVSSVVVGQWPVTEALLIAVASRGHVLLEGPPGVAKTLLAGAFSRTLDADFARVQFTPDMLPSDLTGTMTLRGGQLEFRPGPIFTNVLLADEINRTPPKTQAALLEAMQERQVTVEGRSRSLEEPFLVVATQNPIEYEGTYPLPEAQLDRFQLKVEVGYPSLEDERELLARPHRGVAPDRLEGIAAVAGPGAIEAIRANVDETTVSPELGSYTVDLVRKTRELPSVTLGASPRAAVHLLAAAKAAARISARDYVTPDDVARMATPVLAHRLVLSPEAALEQYSARDAIAAAIGSVPVPR